MEVLFSILFPLPVIAGGACLAWLLDKLFPNLIKIVVKMMEE